MPGSALRSPVAGTRTTLAVLLAVVAACIAFAVPRAAAADITPRSTVSVAVDTSGVSTNPAGQPVYWDWEKVLMKVTWAVPDGSQPGDYFTVPLDPQLAPSSFVPFDLPASDGSGAVVARATIQDGVVRFTLTDYVLRHRAVHGVAEFRAGFDYAQLNTTTPTVVDVYGTKLLVNRDPGPTGSSEYKYGVWQPSEAAATARDASGALVQRDRAQLYWTIVLRNRVGTPPRGWSSLTVVDTASSGSHFDCARLNARIRTFAADGATPTLDVLSCAAGRVEFRVTKAAANDGVYGIVMDGWLDTNAAGQPVYTDAGGNTHVGFNPEGFGNRADLSYDGITSTVSTVFKRTAQGGSGVGTGNAPRVDIEKYSGAWDGIAFTNGAPLLDESGQPGSLPAGDNDVAPGLTVAPGASTTVTMRVTNTGTETLNGVTVADATLTGPAVTGVTCTFNGSTAMPFNGLAPGQSFLCTGTLAAFAGTHTDRSTVTGTGADSGTQVSDADLFTAVSASAAVTGSATPAGTTPAGTTPAPTVTTSPPAGASISIQQASKPLLTIAKRAGARRVAPGGLVRWTLTVRNVGGAAARRGGGRRPPSRAQRSEERRVGKECRSRWSPYH